MHVEWRAMNTTHPLDKLTIKGFKSIRELEDFELRKLNILIGANGAGKSNFIELFRMLRTMMDQNLNYYVMKQGGADDFLFNGPKVTASIMAHFCFGKNEYSFELEPTADEKLLIKREAQKYEKGDWKVIGANIFESNLPERRGLLTKRGVGGCVYHSIFNWAVYHFHDTGSLAPMRRSEIVEDHKRLRQDAANIAPFLLYLRNHCPKRYREVLNAVRLVIPFFEDFLLDPVGESQYWPRGNVLDPARLDVKEIVKVKLMWRQKGSDYPMQPYHFSDGSIRFICLATALLQPNPPSIIIIDEPELGLHPEAIAILAELIQDAAKRTQLIVATQSPLLINYFSLEDIVVVSRSDGQSTFRRLNEQDFSEWLKEYSVGELWTKNVILGGPVHE